MSSRRAALFDVDRTLIRKDTATLFARYRHDVGASGVGELLQVAWWMLEYSLGVVDAPRVAEKALRAYRGTREVSLVETCERWYPTYVRPHVSSLGKQRVLEHQRAGDVVVLVTGTTRYAAMPLARDLEIRDVVCSELRVDAQGCFTGEVLAPLCFGSGKLDRVEAWAREANVRLEDSVFYTDSITDLPLLERVRSPVAVNPDRRLRLLAKRRAWPIERW